MRVATTSNLADRNRVGERLLEFYRTLAKGGVGTIVTEALRISAQEAYGAGALVVHDRPAVEGLRRLADVCHAEGALLIGQLNHGGRQHLASRVIPHMVAPSAVACPRSGGVPHALSTREVREMVEMYIMCAVHCIEAGMDGVEIHGAQGHLIQQFVSPFSNRRDGRLRRQRGEAAGFPRQIIEGVQAALGRSRAIVGYRLGVEEFTEGGLGIEQTLEIARLLTADGQLDYLSLSQGNFNTIETHLPDRHWPILAFRTSMPGSNPRLRTASDCGQHAHPRAGAGRACAGGRRGGHDRHVPCIAGRSRVAEQGTARHRQKTFGAASPAISAGAGSRAASR